MSFVELDFSYENPVLAPLADLVPPTDKSSLDITLGQLPESMAKPIGVIYKVLTGSEPLEDLTVFRLVFREDKSTPKLYPPALYQKDGQLVIRWGNDLIPVELNGDQYELNFDLARIGRYEDTSLIVVVPDFGGFDEVTMPFPVKKANFEEEFNLKQAKIYLKKGETDKLVDLLAEPKTGGSDSDIPLVNTDDLPQGVDIQVVKARAVNTKFGKNYMLVAKENPDVGLYGPVKFFGFSRIKQKLNSGALISEEYPATLNFTKGANDKGETRYEMTFDVHWPETQDTLKLSSILSDWG
jgi:hypothetical protein